MEGLAEIVQFLVRSIFVLLLVIYVLLLCLFPILVLILTVIAVPVCYFSPIRHLISSVLSWW
jgi:hypothetical protein